MEVMRIRILLVEMPHMLRDIIGSILGVEPDLSVVANDVEVGALVERVERDRPDVVVLCEDSASTLAMCEELLRRFPRLALVALEERGQRASIYMMRPTRIRVAEISRTQLVTAIRRAAGPVPFPASVSDASSMTTLDKGKGEYGHQL
jgi:DNA-binding NarL/FixJ family response regulator